MLEGRGHGTKSGEMATNNREGRNFSASGRSCIKAQSKPVITLSHQTLTHSSFFQHHLATATVAAPAIIVTPENRLAPLYPPCPMIAPVIGLPISPLTLNTQMPSPKYMPINCGLGAICTRHGAESEMTEPDQNPKSAVHAIRAAGVLALGQQKRRMDTMAPTATRVFMRPATLSAMKPVRMRPKNEAPFRIASM